MKVCKTMFLSTLGVGHGFVTHAMENCQDGTFVGKDKRGRHELVNKISEEDRNSQGPHRKLSSC
jgi:hypothetical protein